MNPRYSLCVTHYNNNETVQESLESLLSQVDGSFEVVVVDSMSTDGSLRKLERYASEGKIILIRKKCVRGVGRQAAFERSTGAYVIANLDMDDRFLPVLRQVVDEYHSRSEGRVLAVVSDPLDWSQNITIGSRDAISSVGGWRDLQYGEDWDLWSRAAESGKYAWTVFPMTERISAHAERRSLLGKLRYRYGRYRDELRLGRAIFDEGENVTILQRLALLLASVSLPFQRTYRSDFNKTFRSSDPSYRIQQAGPVT